MLRRLFLLLVAAVSCALASAAPVGAASTTIAEAVPGVYDAPVTTRGAIQGLGDLTNASSQPAGSQERSAARSVTTQGQSTTPHSRSVAAEAAGGSLDNADVYRYVSEGEANAARSMGRVPNTDVLGKPRSVFYSPDYIDSVAEAEQSLQIGAMNPGGATAPPGFRITASPQGAQWTYGGNVAGGSGIEMLTDQALKVLRIDRLPR